MGNPVERPLIIGRKSIMQFLQIENWDSVARMIKNSGLPVGKPAGRWIGVRVHLQEWLAERTGIQTSGTSSRNIEQALDVVKRLSQILPQVATGSIRGRRAARKRFSKMRQLYRQGI